MEKNKVKEIKSITIKIKHTDGGEKVVGFVRPKKIKELFSDEGSLGAFLVDLAGGVLERI